MLKLLNPDYYVIDYTCIYLICYKVLKKRLRIISENMSLVLKLLDGSILQTIDAENTTTWWCPWILQNQLKNN